MNLADVFSKFNQFKSHFKQRAPESAKFAKERLQIIISHECAHRDKPDYLAAMQKDLLDVIAKYVAINKDDVKVELARQEGCSVLELNVTLPQQEFEAAL